MVLLDKSDHCGGIYTNCLDDEHCEVGQDIAMVDLKVRLLSEKKETNIPDLSCLLLRCRLDLWRERLVYKF